MAVGAVGVAVVVGGASVAAGTAVAATVTVVMSVAVHRNFMTHGALCGRRLRMEASISRPPARFVLLRRVCLVAHRAAGRPLVLPNRTLMLRGAP